MVDTRSSPSDSNAILARMAQDSIVPVIVLEDAQKAVPLATALTAGGCGLVEITLRTSAALESIEAIAKSGVSMVGAGTVLEPDQVRAAQAAGARFIVSPGLDAAVVATARALDLLVIPGVSTASEAQAAWNMGLRLVKFFPASTSGGPSAIGMLATTFRGMQFMPSGGIDAGNLSEYLAIPAVIACGGTWLAPAEAITAGAFDEITRRTAAAARAAQAAKRDSTPQLREARK